MPTWKPPDSSNAIIIDDAAKWTPPDSSQAIVVGDKPAWTPPDSSKAIVQDIPSPSELAFGTKPRTAPVGATIEKGSFPGKPTVLDSVKSGLTEAELASTGAERDGVLGLRKDVTGEDASWSPLSTAMKMARDAGVDEPRMQELRKRIETRKQADATAASRGLHPANLITYTDEAGQERQRIADTNPYPFERVAATLLPNIANPVGTFVSRAFGGGDVDVPGWLYENLGGGPVPKDKYGHPVGAPDAALQNMAGVAGDVVRGGGSAVAGAVAGPAIAGARAAGADVPDWVPDGAYAKKLATAAYEGATQKLDDAAALAKNIHPGQFMRSLVDADSETLASIAHIPTQLTSWVTGPKRLEERVKDTAQTVGHLVQDSYGTWKYLTTGGDIYEIPDRILEMIGKGGLLRTGMNLALPLQALRAVAAGGAAGLESAAAKQAARDGVPLREAPTVTPVPKSTWGNAFTIGERIADTAATAVDPAAWVSAAGKRIVKPFFKAVDARVGGTFAGAVADATRLAEEQAAMAAEAEAKLGSLTPKKQAMFDPEAKRAAQADVKTAEADVAAATRDLKAAREDLRQAEIKAAGEKLGEAEETAVASARARLKAERIRRASVPKEDRAPFDWRIADPEAEIETARAAKKARATTEPEYVTAARQDVKTLEEALDSAHAWLEEAKQAHATANIDAKAAYQEARAKALDDVSPGAGQAYMDSLDTEANAAGLVKDARDVVAARANKVRVALESRRDAITNQRVEAQVASEERAAQLRRAINNRQALNEIDRQDILSAGRKDSAAEAAKIKPLQRKYDLAAAKRRAAVDRLNGVKMEMRAALKEGGDAPAVTEAQIRARVGDELYDRYKVALKEKRATDGILQNHPAKKAISAAKEESRNVMGRARIDAAQLKSIRAAEDARMKNELRRAEAAARDAARKAEASVRVDAAELKYETKKATESAKRRVAEEVAARDSHKKYRNDMVKQVKEDLRSQIRFLRKAESELRGFVEDIRESTPPPTVKPGKATTRAGQMADSLRLTERALKRAETLVDPLTSAPSMAARLVKWGLDKATFGNNALPTRLTAGLRFMLTGGHQHAAWNAAKTAAEGRVADAIFRHREGLSKVPKTTPVAGEFAHLSKNDRPLIAEVMAFEELADTSILKQYVEFNPKAPRGSRFAPKGVAAETLPPQIRGWIEAANTYGDAVLDLAEEVTRSVLYEGVVGLSEGSKTAEAVARIRERLDAGEHVLDVARDAKLPTMKLPDGTETGKPYMPHNYPSQQAMDNFRRDRWTLRFGDENAKAMLAEERDARSMERGGPGRWNTNNATSAMKETLRDRTVGEKAHDYGMQASAEAIVLGGFVKALSESSTARMWRELAKDPTAVSRVPQPGWVKISNGPINDTLGTRRLSIDLPGEVWVHPDIAGEIVGMEWIHRINYGNPLLSVFTRATSAWKTLITAGNPGTHVTNAMGNVFVLGPLNGFTPWMPTETAALAVASRVFARGSEAAKTSKLGAWAEKHTPTLKKAFDSGADGTILGLTAEQQVGLWREFTTNGGHGGGGNLTRLETPTPEHGHVGLYYEGLTGRARAIYDNSKDVMAAAGEMIAGHVDYATRAQFAIKTKELAKSVVEGPIRIYRAGDDLIRFAHYIKLRVAEGMDVAPAINKIRDAYGAYEKLAGVVQVISTSALGRPFLAFPAAMVTHLGKLYNASRAKVNALVRLTDQITQQNLLAAHMTEEDQKLLRAAMSDRMRRQAFPKGAFSPDAAFDENGNAVFSKDNEKALPEWLPKHDVRSVAGWVADTFLGQNPYYKSMTLGIGWDTFRNKPVDKSKYTSDEDRRRAIVENMTAPMAPGGRSWNAIGMASRDESRNAFVEPQSVSDAVSEALGVGNLRMDPRKTIDTIQLSEASEASDLKRTITDMAFGSIGIGKFSNFRYNPEEVDKAAESIRTSLGLSREEFRRRFGKTFDSIRETAARGGKK